MGLGCWAWVGRGPSQEGELGGREGWSGPQGGLQLGEGGGRRWAWPMCGQGEEERWEQGRGVASAQEEVEAWANIRDRFAHELLCLG